ncbi:diacylglycerol acyltransferase-domain-containing protein [Rhypophila decipiens]|uniref:diacylglycerol O-acyltransferase n=1 Tax=Rhypophila decipiens TaxID=261697 RepID=A0AAN6YG82_9PEZI|nr:diacylglycerol acyltransferase-domain-containing protein [Rhypophila decipiens]
MDSHEAESSHKAAGSALGASSKKKRGKKNTQGNNKKPTPKPQRSEIPVLRIIDGNAAPSPPTSSSGANNNTAEQISPTQSKKEQRVVFEDAGNDENAESPVPTRTTQPNQVNGDSNGPDTSDAIGKNTTEAVKTTHRRPSRSSPAKAAFYSAAAAVAQPDQEPKEATQTKHSDTEQDGEKEPETYAEAVKEGLADGDKGMDDQKHKQDDKPSHPETNGSHAKTQTSTDGPRQRHTQSTKKQEVEDDDYPVLPIPRMTRDGVEQVRVDAYEAGGVRFAPWNIPLQRRLQTLAVMIHCLSIASTASFFFFLCAIPLTWPILIPYLLHILLSKAATDGKLRFRSERFRRLNAWKHFADYFPAKLHKTHDLPPTRKYIFGYHPHGIISHGGFAAFGTEALGFSEKFPGITNSLLTLDSNFRIPIYREYILALGLRSVSKESIINTLTQGGPNNEGMGRAVTIVIGGARESLEAQPGTMHLVLGERKGFIKLAIRTGADIVPVIAFGENDLYDQVSPKTHPNLRKMQMYALRTLKFTLPFLHGRGIFNYDVGLMPYRRPLNIVVGKPIKVTQAKDGVVAEAAEVDRLHGEYVKELTKMWNRYKDQFLPRRTEELQIMN